VSDRLLSICIPTHHGRCTFLSQLIGSIDHQVEQHTANNVSVCISDNGSLDGTQEMVSAWSEKSIVQIKYFRFEKNEGLLNFENVIDMADGTFCWMVGSDDIIPPGAIEKILKIIKSNRLSAGFTFNKLNFNADYTKLIGRDDNIVLPETWQQVRELISFDDIATEMFFLFQFISGHVFRKTAWMNAFSSFGRDRFRRMNHFAFSAIIFQITRNANIWYWYPDFLITQRLGNSFLIKELGKFEFAIQCTGDLMRLLETLFPAETTPRKVMSDLLRKTFIIYWNPFLLLEYKSTAPFSIRQDIKMFIFCWRYFSRIPLFIFTSAPVLIVPGILGWITRLLGIKAINIIRMPLLNFKRVPLRSFFIKILEALNIGSNTELDHEADIVQRGAEIIAYVKNL
jgi:glycosyltransferase involved in cell wall biosynthesis